MDHGSGYISLGTEQLHYLRMGSGKRLLIAFHGYGNDAGLFAPFADYLGHEFTLISVDIPHHGQSKWPENKPFTLGQLKILIETFKKEARVEKVSLIGYSIGGRVCLSIIEQMPESIDSAVLISPDGLVFNPFYYFVTRSFVGKGLFRNFLKNMKRYLPLVDWLKERKIISASRYKFGMYYLQTEESREFLLQVWPGMSQIVPDTRRLKAAIKQYHIPVHIFMGAYDKVIPIAEGKQFERGMKTVKLHIVEKGHQLLDNDTIPKIAECLLS